MNLYYLAESNLGTNEHLLFYLPIPYFMKQKWIKSINTPSIDTKSDDFKPIKLQKWHFAFK